MITAKATLACSAVVALLAAAGCGGGDGDAEAQAPGAATIPQPTRAQLEAAGLEKLPLAPESDRIDISAPTFSNPTQIDNPLFPISELESAILSGRVDGKPFHTETTLLPETRIIEWSDGQSVEARVSQYMAFIDGRIEEVATDYYAQADDGSVWYLGEEVFDYGEAGLVDSNAGSWLAGREGPPEMIMPADPKVGDAHRAENIPAIAFEEIAIKTVGKTVAGPTGAVDGAMVARELHDDGSYSDKVFAPGYGEFLTRDGGDVEAVALALPADALPGAPPAELETLTRSALTSFDSVRSGAWGAAAAGAQDARRAWQTYRRDPQPPPRLATEMDRALHGLTTAVEARTRSRAASAAIDVVQSALDFELRYGTPEAIDLARFELWGRQVLVDAEAGDLGAVRGDIATLEWVRDRFAHTVDPVALTRIDIALVELRDAVANENNDLAAAHAEAAGLLEILRSTQALKRR